ncbi:MAG: CAAX prenyl protease-related protein [Chthoniobacteraceae bacterium]
MFGTDRPYTLPFLIFMLFLALSALMQTELGGFESPWLSSPQYWIFPLQTMVCSGLVIFYWRQYPLRTVRNPVITLLIAVFILILWISPQWLFHAKPRLDGFNPTFFPEGSPLYWWTVVFRFIRLVIAVPFVEEIFWRGWLLRWLIDERIEEVPFGQFQWKSFLITSIAFMLVHQPADWAAAFICGLAYNFVACRTRSLASCILAHAVTNLLLGFYIMQTKQWGFW